MKKAVIFGAGSIGRGFIAQLLFESGYKIIFIELNKLLVRELNESNEYTIRLVSNDGYKEIVIRGISAISANDKDSVTEELASADIAATAIGASALPGVAGIFAEAISLRESNMPPLNVLLCENLMDAADVFRKQILKHLDDAELLSNLGLVETSIGRTVPVVTDEMRAGNPLLMFAESFCEMPVDAAGFIGDIPDIKGMIPYQPFRFFEERKLYIHNLGHSVISYIGFSKNYKFINEAISDSSIYECARLAMLGSASAIAKAYNADPESLFEHVYDLLSRMKNKALGDTIQRGCRNPLRKLSPNDRFAGAVKRCADQGVLCGEIYRAIAYALLYTDPSDEESLAMQEKIAINGVQDFLETHCELTSDQCKQVIEEYNSIIDTLPLYR